FFRAPTWENLTSFKADSVDSTRRAAEAKPKKKSRRELRAERKARERFVADSLAAAARGDTLTARGDTAAPAGDGLPDSTRASAANPPDPSGPALPPPPVSAADTLSSPAGAGADSLGAGAPADTAERPRTATGGRKKSPFLTDSALYIGPDGDFIRRPYKAQWSFDAVNAAVGVDNYYGAGGLAFLTLSDLMGDQRISFAFSINGSLENVNAFAEYAWLPHRADFTVMGYHESQNSAYLAFSRDGSNEVFVNDATDKRLGLGLGAR